MMLPAPPDRAASTQADYYEWRYVRRGSVTHALGQIGDYSVACGVDRDDPSDWLDDTDAVWNGRVGSRPRCKRCLAAIGALGEVAP